MLKTITNKGISFGKIFDSEGNIIDEAIVLVMRSPNSYTKEDVVELQCHGSALVLRKVLLRTLDLGARLAERGEFTKRAFLNGRLDLSQAQAVLDVIQAKTDEALKMAENKLNGIVKNEIFKVKHKILDIITHIEAIIDFPEDDIDDVSRENIEQGINDALNEVNKFLKYETKDKILKEGIETVILGKPNVGKSSLLNFLSKNDKAIVTNIPGTTRDLIEEIVNIEGIPLKIIDTAGIHNSSNEIENIGINKSIDCAKKADLILALFDGSRILDAEDEKIFNLIQGNNAMILITKSDLPKMLNVEELQKQFPKLKLISISVKNQNGISELQKSILEMIENFSDELNYIKSARELEILKRVKQNFEQAKETAKLDAEIDLISIDLRYALQALDTLTGESVDEEIINEIFSKFCVGK